MTLTAELERAERQMIKSKDIIRTCIKFCEEHEATRGIESGHYDEEGAIAEGHIRCCK